MCVSVWLLWDRLIGVGVIPLGESEVCVCGDLGVTAWVWVCPQVPLGLYVGGLWVSRVSGYSGSPTTGPTRFWPALQSPSTQFSSPSNRGTPVSLVAWKTKNVSL